MKILSMMASLFREPKRGIELQLFAEGGASDGGGMGTEGGTNAAQALPQNGEEGKVLYGKQNELPENTDNAENDNNAKEPTFDELISGKFKNEFEERLNKVIGRKLAAERRKTDPQQKIIARLQARYGVKTIDELEAALDDPTGSEARAIEMGMSTEAQNEYERVMAENILYQQEREQAAAQIQAIKQMEAWEKEAESVREIYPDFDLKAELNNPHFTSLIKTKNPEYAISMLDAYRIVHHEELANALQRDAAMKISQSVQARNQRPPENGINTSAGVIVKNDVSKLTKKDREEIAKRVQRGEKIVF